MNLRKILIVDDEPGLRAIAALSLRNVGKWQVVVAASGAEALELARAERPDAILMDVMMPDLDGPGTFVRLREQPDAPPVIFMTALIDPHEHERLLSLGARGVIVKPFSPRTLPTQIRACLGAS
jgi:two-component system, OmpR family, response regulator